MQKSESEATSPITKCPYCKEVYASADVTQIESKERSSYVHSKCQKCKNAMMLHIRYKGGGIECAGFLTDWSAKDAKRFLHGEKITVDDVIEMHEVCSLDNFPELR